MTYPQFMDEFSTGCVSQMKSSKTNKNKRMNIFTFVIDHIQINVVLRLLFIGFIFFVVLKNISFSQHTPPVNNYRVSDYKAHQQNWDMAQSSDRTMHFANTSGLLSFNGNQWNLDRLNNKIIRSTVVVGDRIYTGAYGEFGYWVKNQCSDLTYHSLSKIFSDATISKEEIWHIIPFKNKIYFQSFSILFVYDGKTIHKISLPGSIMFLHNVGGRLIFQALDHGLYELKSDQSIQPILGTDFFKGKTVSGILPYNKADLMVTTNSHGIYLIQNGNITEWNPSLKNYFSDRKSVV